MALRARVLQDPAGRAPDEVLLDRVGRGAERDAAADQPLHLEALAQALEREGRGRSRPRPGWAPARARRVTDQADERMDLVGGDEGADRRQRPDQLHRAGLEADLLLGLAQGGRPQVLVGLVLAAARERDLPGVAAQVVRGAR